MPRQTSLLVALLAACVLVLSAVWAQAAAPRTISYQGRLYDSSGQSITGTREVTFKLYDEVGAATAVWTEMHSSVAFNEGVFSVVLGSGTDLNLDFGQPYWLGIQISGDSEMSPRLPLNSAPYSLNAETKVQKTGDDMTGPLSVTTNSSVDAAVTVTQSGSIPHALTAQITDADSSGSAVYGVSQGLGYAGHFRINRSASSSPALYAYTNGTGPAALLSGQLKLSGINGKVTFPDGTSQTTAEGVLTGVEKTALVGGGSTTLHDHDTLYVHKTGDTGMTGNYEINDGRLVVNLNDINYGLRVDQAGTGTAGSFAISHTTSGAAALYATTASSQGEVAMFMNENTSATGSVVYARQRGDGKTMEVINTGDGTAGYFEVDNTSTSLSTPALYATTNATNGRAARFEISDRFQAGDALYVTNAGSGNSVVALNTGSGHAGRFEMDNSESSGDALYATTNGDGSSAGRFVSSNNGSTVPAVSVSNSGNGAAVYGKSTGAGRAGYFQVQNASSAADAVYASTNGTGQAGLFETTNAANADPALTGQTNGSGAAVQGINTGTGRAAYFETQNTANTQAAVYATTNAVDAYCAQFRSTNTANEAPTLRVDNLHASGASADAAVFNGNVQVNGHLTKSSGGFVQPHSYDPSKEVVYAFFEGPEHAVFLRGRAQLVNGRAEIVTPEHFRLVAAEEGILVQLTPSDLTSRGLAAYRVGRDRILVGELMDGRGSYEFDYFITAKRNGFQAHNPIQDNHDFTANHMTKSEYEKVYSGGGLTQSAMRALLISNGTLNPDGSLNLATARALGWTLEPEPEPAMAQARP